MAIFHSPQLTRSASMVFYSRGSGIADAEACPTSKLTGKLS